MCVTIYTRYVQCRNHNPLLSSFMTYHRVCNKSNTTGETCGAGTDYPSVAPEITLIFSGVCVARSLIFYVMFCRSLFVLFIFGHCIDCSSSIYVFWLPPWYLQTSILLLLSKAVRYSLFDSKRMCFHILSIQGIFKLEIGTRYSKIYGKDNAFI